MIASRMRRLPFALALAFALATAVPADATVVDVKPNGFMLEITTHIAAPADKVYATLITPAHWWSPEHTFSGDARNLTFDPRAGGCWCEKLPHGGSAVHLSVVYVEPGKVLRLRGALGPFQALGVDGALTWSLKPAGDGTDVSLTYELGGYGKDGFAEWSMGADSVLTEQVGRLKRLVETGSPGKPQS